MYNIQINANDGGLCWGLEHQFRICSKVPDAVEFRANNLTFADRLEGALIEHQLRHGNRWFWNIQYRAVYGSSVSAWWNIQNPTTGAVVTINADILKAPDTAVTLYRWACISLARWLDTAAKRHYLVEHVQRQLRDQPSLEI
ncbi:MAG: hypothetical protein WCK77_12050 [Verrucomicrobiota bacterium]